MTYIFDTKTNPNNNIECGLLGLLRGICRLLQRVQNGS